jgi:UDP-3-O-[3-hydroxymyristoyl] glucosamine N-acyltransferase
MSEVILGHNVTIGSNVTFGHYVVIKDNVTIGNNTHIGDFCIIGEISNPFAQEIEHTVVGKNCLLRSNTIIYAGARIGDYVHTGNRAIIREQSEVGNNVMIGLQSELQGDCSVGEYSRIQSNVSVGKYTKIGSYVFIYPNCVFTNDNTPPSGASDGSSIGDFSQICTGVIILPSTIIGRFCLVSAGSRVAGLYMDDVWIDGSPASNKGKLSKMPFFNKSGKRHYPWPLQYDAGMPWQGLNFLEWAKERKIELPDIF